MNGVRIESRFLPRIIFCKEHQGQKKKIFPEGTC